MKPTAEWRNLPFDKAIEYFRNKVNFPTEKWDDISGGMHSRAFVVAGVTRDDMLCEFRTAIDSALANGTSIDAFRKDFDNIVAKYGWEYKGEKTWRQNVIFNTNIMSAYSAGQWAQIEEDVDVFPFIVYRTMDDGLVRPEHRAWDNLILRVTDKFWQTHYPPNGWRCRCWVDQLTEAEAKAQGVSTAPELEHVEHVNSKTGEVRKTVKGIDYGFDYNTGITSWGSKLNMRAVEKGEKAWIPLTDTDYKVFGRPANLPLVTSDIAEIEPLKSTADVSAWLKESFGADEKVFSLRQGEFKHSLLINADVLGSHLEDLNRSRFLPFLEDILTDPYEVWAAFEESKKDGKVALRYRYVKAYKLGKNRGMSIILDAQGGCVLGWTYIPTMDMKQVNKQRYGRLLYGK